jgi:hypothetical protein
MDFLANFFELWGCGYLGPFSQYMYKADLYLEIFLWLLLLPLVALAVYYVFWDNIRFAKNWIWALLVLVLSLIVGTIGFCNADAGIYDYLNSHHITNSQIEDVDYIYFSLICFCWTLVWSFLLSLILKYKSVKGRYIPF